MTRPLCTQLAFLCLTTLLSLAAACSSAPPSPPASGSDGGSVASIPVGARCHTDSDCGGGSCLTSYPSGYCTEQCTSNSSCPSGSTCSTTPEGPQTCLKDCTSIADCRNGYTCDSSSQVCVPNTDGGSTTTTTGGGIGSACSQSSDCTAGPSPACFQTPGGYCTSGCNSNSDCPNGTCVPNIAQDAQGNTASACLENCSSSSGCRSGYVCEMIQTGGVCLPACMTDADCGAGNSCDTSSGQCQQGSNGNPASAMDGGTITNGNVSINKTLLGTVVANGAPIGFTVPANAVSTYLVASPASNSTSTMIALYTLTGPSGTVNYNASNQTNAYDAAPNENGSIGVMYPNAPPPRTSNNPYNLPGLNYTPGNYKASFVNVDSQGNVTTGQSYNMVMLTKSVSGSLTSGTLDLNIWFDTSAMTATQAKTNSSFQTMIQSAKSIWSAVGITVGQVNYLTLPDSRGSYRNISGNGDEGALCALTAGAPNDSINWVLIDSIGGGGANGGVILGETAGLPGTPLRGTGASCVAVSMSAWGQMSPSAFAPIVVHETGHWLGLFHPTESPGTMFDPLPDTPQCASSCDRNGDGQVDDLECSSTQLSSQCGGGTNLMFWLADSTGNHPHTTLTSDQQFVLLRHPAVQ